MAGTSRSRWRVWVGIACTACMCLPGCGDDDPRDLPWEIAFATPELRASTVLVEATIVEGGCPPTGTERYGTTFSPTDVRSSMRPPDLGPGDYAFHAVARDAACLNIAEACEAVTLPRADESPVELLLSALGTPSPACPADECNVGRCSGDGVDAGGSDGGADAGVVCAPDTADCNLIASDGCEADLSSSATCGDCVTSCAGATPLCRAGDCVSSCMPAETECGTSCVDVQTEVAHCGGCDMLCTVDDGTPDCVAGVCTVAACDAGFDDCDADATNGCEVDLRSSTRHCGACGSRCASACVGGRCLDGVTSVCGGEEHSCANVDGATWCWGRNNQGQVADGSTTRRVMGAVATLFTGVVAEVDCGRRFTCARLATGGLECAGENNNGQLGRGTAGGAMNVGPVSMLSGVIDIGIGTQADHACAVDASGAAWCWGVNEDGQVGDGSRTERTAPVRVTMVADAVQIDTGETHSCALRAPGTVACWGDNGDDQLGDGSGIDRSTTAVTAMGLAAADEIATGQKHTCARVGGQLWCWGAGVGNVPDSGVPVRVAGVTDAASIAAGVEVTCFVRTGGAVACFGNNHTGQLGDGTIIDRNAPVAVLGIGDASLVGLGSGGPTCLGCSEPGHACAGRAGGVVSCWGENGEGQLGDATQTASSSPVTVVGIP